MKKLKWYDWGCFLVSFFAVLSLTVSFIIHYPGKNKYQRFNVNSFDWIFVILLTFWIIVFLHSLSKLLSKKKYLSAIFKCKTNSSFKSYFNIYLYTPVIILNLINITSIPFFMLILCVIFLLSIGNSLILKRFVDGINSDGITYNGKFFEWENIEVFSFEGHNRLMFKLRKRYLFATKLEFLINAEEKEEIRAFLSSK